MNTSEMLSAVAQAELMDAGQAEEICRRVRAWRQDQTAEALADRYYEALRALCRTYRDIGECALRVQGRMAQILAGAPVDTDGELCNFGAAQRLDRAVIRLRVEREVFEMLTSLVAALPSA